MRRPHLAPRLLADAGRASLAVSQGDEGRLRLSRVRPHVGEGGVGSPGVWPDCQRAGLRLENSMWNSFRFLTR